MKSSAILRRAKAILGTEETFTTNAYGRKINSPYSFAFWGYDKGVVCWCSAGALQAVVGHHNPIVATRYLNAASYKLFGFGLVTAANDVLGFDAIHVVYDEAIKQAIEAGD